MPYDETLADRIRDVLLDRDDVIEKKMFGGLCFMVRGHMTVGIVRDELMARVGPEHYARYVEEPHAREMDFTGKALKGFVYIEPAGFAQKRSLAKWIGRALQFVDTLPPK